MHVEILVEDSSGAALLKHLIPKIIGGYGAPHTWRIIDYKGVGRIPKNLNPTKDPAKRFLLDQLPRLLRGYGKTPGFDNILVILDNDNKKCSDFLKELLVLAKKCKAPSRTLFRLAIEEIEAWYMGDREALQKGYPKAKQAALRSYKQDSICGTWEILADAIYPGGAHAIKKAGWPLPGQVKHEWAKKLGPLMDPENNISPSFKKLKEGLRALVASEE